MKAWQEGLWASDEPWELTISQAGVALTSCDRKTILSAPLDALPARLVLQDDAHFCFDGQTFRTEPGGTDELKSHLPKPEREIGSHRSTPAQISKKSFAARFGTVGAVVGFIVMFTLPTGGSLLASAIIGAICGAGGNALGAALGSFLDALRENVPPEKVDKTKSPFAVASAIIGCIGLAAWFLPIVGVPVGIAGFLTGRTGRMSPKRTMALVGMCLGLICLYLSVANCFLGALGSIRSAIRRNL